MGVTGTKNCLTDIQGIMVGHFHSLDAASGVTVIVCPEGATAGVDVRGAAPGTRETDALDPVNLVEKVHAVVLTGGSVYGLSAADGVIRWLSEKGWGFPLERGFTAPIVPAACLFDLGRGAEYIPPTSHEWGRRACEALSSGPVPLGTAGAGTGAVSGGVKGGLGSASEALDSGPIVAALVAVNSLGVTIDPDTGAFWEKRMEMNGELGPLGLRRVKPPRPQAPRPAENTTIAVVATDAELTKAQARKVAQMAHDGLARAIRPAHTMFDGDTIFCLSVGKRELPDTEGFFVAAKAPAINEVGRAAADCLTRAIMRAMVEAESLGAFKAFRDLEER